jgi:sulfate transport system permease protein
VATKKLGAKKFRVLPGFRLTLGYTLFYLGLIVLIPLAAVFMKAGTLSWAQFSHTVFSPQALAAYRLSFGASFFAALVNAIFGLIVAWVLVRYNFFGKKFVDALVDLPFALPTAVAGITLATLYAPGGWIGGWLAPLGIKVSYTQLGIFVALTFIGLPFIVRTVQPVLEDFDPELEDAAASLGANRWQIFWRVIFPTLTPALLTGFALAFARALGEYGSVVFISSNIPMKTQIVPLLIMSELDSFEYAKATALAVVMLVVSFLLLLAINLLQWRSNRYNTNNLA